MFNTIKKGVESFDLDQLNASIKAAKTQGGAAEQLTYAGLSQAGLGSFNQRTGSFDINKQAVGLAAELKVRKETGVLNEEKQADIMARIQQFTPQGQGKSLEQIKTERAQQGNLYENQALNVAQTGVQAGLSKVKGLEDVSRDVQTVAKTAKVGEGANETVTALSILNTYQAKALEFLSQIANNTGGEKNKLVESKSYAGQSGEQTQKSSQVTEQKKESAPNISPNINITVNANGNAAKYEQSTPQLAEELKKTVESFYTRLDALEQRADNGKLPAAPPASAPKQRSDIDTVYGNMR